jgi:hypothetical protein
MHARAARPAVSANDSGDRVLGAYFPLEIFRICFRKCRRNVRLKKRELLFIRRMLKAGISPQKSAITRFSAGFSGVYFPIRICRVFFVGNDGSTS